MQLPPIAQPRPPPPSLEKLGEEWVADRRHQTSQFLDWMADGLLPGGVTFLSQAHGENTRLKARELLEKAVNSSMGETKDKPIGSPALWAILLAQQAHALQHGWEVADHRERWCVRAMHALLHERQNQSVRLGGGSRAPRDTSTVGRGLGGAQQVRDPPPPPHPTPGPHPLPPRSCAQLAGRSSEEARMRALRVDELGNDDAIKAKVGEHLLLSLSLSLTLTLTLTLTRSRTLTRQSF
jgi:hypothetical protein